MRLVGDPPLAALLSGGIYAFSEIRRLGITRATVPAAFDAEGFVLPLAVVKSRVPVPIGGLTDLEEQVGARRTVMEIWVYEDQEYTTIDLSLTHIYRVLQGHKLAGAWPLAWAFQTVPLVDNGSLKGASVKRVDYSLTDLIKVVA